MLLTDIRHYIEQHGRVSLQDLTNRFDIEPDAMRAMLGKWESKGRIAKLIMHACASGCAKCDASHIEIYQWLEKASAENPSEIPSVDTGFQGFFTATNKT